MGGGNAKLAAIKTVATNRRARFDYEILDTLEAGIVLTGQEVKSCRLGHVDLAGAYVSFAGSKPMLKHVKISKYPAAGPLPDYQPDHDRLLLLKGPEAHKLRVASEEKGMSIVPLEVKAGRFVKVVLGLGRGRKRIDKRAKIKEREVERKLRQKGDY